MIKRLLRPNKIVTVIILILIVCYFAFFHKSSLNTEGNAEVPKDKVKEGQINAPLVDEEKKKDPPEEDDSGINLLMAKDERIDVPLINQMSAPRLYNGCEITSLAMILNFSGINVTKNELADKVQKVPLTYDNGLKGNPNKGFVGNMPDGPGLTVYHGPVAALAKKYAGDRVEDLTGEDISKVYQKIDQGLPVWIITTTTFAPVNDFKTWDTPEGKVDVTFSVHSVVITGYDKQSVWINNPYGTKNQKLDKDNFEKAWVQMGRQAIVINTK